MGFDFKKDLLRRKAAYRLEKRINWDSPERTPGKTTLFKSSHQRMDVSVQLMRHFICMAIIYGMESEGVETESGVSRYHFSGFKEKYGRMPNAYDDILLMVGEDYFANRHEGAIYSKINWRLSEK